MKNTNQIKLVQLLTAFMDHPAINRARHTDNDADALACDIERLLTSEGFYDPETGDNQFPPLSPAEMGRRGGSVTSADKTTAARLNGAKGGRPKGKKGKAAKTT